MMLSFLTVLWLQNDGPTSSARGLLRLPQADSWRADRFFPSLRATSNHILIDRFTSSNGRRHTWAGSLGDPELANCNHAPEMRSGRWTDD